MQIMFLSSKENKFSCGVGDGTNSNLNIWTLCYTYFISVFTFPLFSVFIILPSQASPLVTRPFPYYKHIRPLYCTQSLLLKRK